MQAPTRLGGAIRRTAAAHAIVGPAWFALALAFPLAAPAAPEQAGSQAAVLAQARAVVASAAQHGAKWKGPNAGPAAQRSKTIAFVAEDLRNGGVLGVAQGFREAAAVVGWTVKVLDAKGSPAERSRALADALAAQPDGVVLCGSDAVENAAALRGFAQRQVPVVGWHAGPLPGPIDKTPVAMNVTTDPLEVARAAAMAAVAQSNGRAGVVVFTDSRFRIATTKAEAMAAVIRGCPQCTLLEVRNVAISESAARMPEAVRELLARHGKRWTHSLAINDIYFDYAVPELIKAGLGGAEQTMLSAGDGSASAFLRIQARTFQSGTVAEPLNLHGWQLVDELNRLFAGEPVSGFVAPVHLVTADNVAFEGGARFQYDPDNGYREAYRRIWQR
jgi:ABC-type sugar transport system substrate-binding protein